MSETQRKYLAAAEARGTPRKGVVTFAHGGKIPEPAGEEDEPEDMIDCPSCGHRFAHGGAVPEQEGEEHAPMNHPPFMHAKRKGR